MNDDELKYQPCPNGHWAEAVIHAERRMRRGYWCPTCNHWQSAIWRQCMVEKTKPTPTELNA